MLSLAEVIMLRRAQEQVDKVLERRYCRCGKPVKLGSIEELCMRCRQMARRNAKNKRRRRERCQDRT